MPPSETMVGSDAISLQLLPRSLPRLWRLAIPGSRCAVGRAQRLSPLAPQRPGGRITGWKTFRQRLIDQLFRKFFVNPHALDVDKFPHAILRKLPPITRPLDAAKGQARIGFHQLIHENAAGLDLSDNS